MAMAPAVAGLVIVALHLQPYATISQTRHPVDESRLARFYGGEGCQKIFK